MVKPRITYHVDTPAQVKRELMEHASLIAKDSVDTALAWLERADRVIEGLAQLPHRYGLAREHRKGRPPLRQIPLSLIAFSTKSMTDERRIVYILIAIHASRDRWRG